MTPLNCVLFVLCFIVLCKRGFGEDGTFSLLGKMMPFFSLIDPIITQEIINRESPSKIHRKDPKPSAPSSRELLEPSVKKNRRFTKAKYGAKAKISVFNS